jgi:hypothetical protein
MSQESEIDLQFDALKSIIENDNNPRLLFSVPESAGDIFLSTSLLQSLKNAYPNYNIYFACNKQFFPILKKNPLIYKVIEFMPIMENQVIMEGTASWKGFFDISIMATVLTQRYINYLNNGKTKIMFDLKDNPCIS